MKELQEKVEEFCENYSIDHPMEHRLIDVMSELGEVSKEILENTEYGSTSLTYSNELKEELGDLPYSLITLANALKIDLESAVNTALEKYESRSSKGGLSSRH